MPRVSSFAAVLLLTALATTGCGDDEMTAGPGDDRSTLYVVSHREGPRVYYTEGAVEQVTLTDDDGDRVAPDGDPDGGSLQWVDLPAGDYTLEAAVRPCDGSCGLLDPPTDSCELPLQLATGPVHVTVTFHYGQACTITVDALQ